MNEQRKLALELANTFDGDVTETVARAKAYLDFLEGGETLAAEQPARPTRGRKAAAAAATTSASTPTASEAPTAAAETSPVPTTDTPAAAQPATAPEAKPAASTSDLTDKDVRTALVTLQTRKGSKEEPQRILSKYATNGVIAGVKKEDYAKLIAECQAVK